MPKRRRNNARHQHSSSPSTNLKMAPCITDVKVRQDCNMTGGSKNRAKAAGAVWGSASIFPAVPLTFVCPGGGFEQERKGKRKESWFRVRSCCHSTFYIHHLHLHPHPPSPSPSTIDTHIHPQFVPSNSSRPCRASASAMPH